MLPPPAPFSSKKEGRVVRKVARRRLVVKFIGARVNPFPAIRLLPEECNAALLQRWGEVFKIEKQELRQLDLLAV
jgi:hypothetical protein